MELLQARAKAAGEDLDTFIGNNPVDINPNIVDDIAPPYSHIEKVGKGYDQMTFDELKSHPRYQELVDMRRDVSSTQANRATNESKASGYYDDTGTYVPSRIKLNDTNRNFASDFELTKADIRAIESGKLTPQIHSKLANDLGRLDYDPNWRSVAQRSADGKIKRGMIEFGIKTDDEIKAVITLFRDADVTTLPHELAHFFRRTMSAEEDKVAREAFEVKGETWDKAAEERFANGFVKYLSYGEAPHPLVAGVFDKFKNWIKDVWVQVNRFNTTPNGTKITDLGMAHQLTPQQKQFYDALLGDRDAAQKLFGKTDITPPVSRSELVSEPHEADKLFHAWGSSDKDIDKLLGIPQELTSFGRNFAQFKGNPKEAIAHLMKVKNGQVRGALYHNEIGEIDIVWGKVIDPKEHTGYGLAHIIDKHGEDIARRLDDITMGGKVIAKDGNKVILKNNQYEGVVKLDWVGKDKKWVLTAFDDTAPHQTIPDDVAKVSKSDNLLDRLDTTIPPKDLKTDKTDTLHQEQTIENDIHTVAPKATWWLPKILNTIKQSDGWATVSKHRLNSVVGYESLKEQTFRDIQTQLTNIEELHHGLKEFSEDTRVAIHRYMTGQKVELHPELKLLADNFRKQINDMGQELVDSGVLAKETFDDWKSVYLHRSYAKHLNKESAKRAFKEGGTLDTVYERGKSLRFKADEIPEIKEDLYANGYKADDIDNANTIDELIALANTRGIAEGGTKITKLPNGKIKLRRDYTFDERLAMGEVEDIAYTLPQTMASLQVMVNNAKFLDSLPNSVIANAKEFTPEVLKLRVRR